MIIEVIGREVRSITDKEASAEKGFRVTKSLTVLHCVNDPKKIDANNVTGKQVFSMSFFDGNGLKSEIEALPIPCTLDADISRNKQYNNLEDFTVI